MSTRKALNAYYTCIERFLKLKKIHGNSEFIGFHDCYGNESIFAHFTMGPVKGPKDCKEEDATVSSVEIGSE